MKPKHFFTVIVGNIGTVTGTTDLLDALEDYTHYVDMSKLGIGRAANEPVTLLLNDEPIMEYIP